MTGATGLVGRALCEAMGREGIPFAVLSRRPDRARRLVPGARVYRLWQPIERGSPWTSLVEKARAVVHLASPLTGPGRWNHSHRQELYEGCVVGTRCVVSALAQARFRPEVLVCASAAAFYPKDPTGERRCSEDDGPAGDDFLARLVADWEAAALHAEQFGVRVVTLRSGLVLGWRGALPRLRRAARLGMGGALPPGTQRQPWVHVDDVVGLVMQAMSDSRVAGALNAVAPHSVTCADFMRAVCALGQMVSGVPQPKWWLRSRLGAGAVMVTNGRGAVAARALEVGYQFRQPSLHAALHHTLGPREAGDGP